MLNSSMCLLHVVIPESCTQTRITVFIAKHDHEIGGAHVKNGFSTVLGLISASSRELHALSNKGMLAA